MAVLVMVLLLFSETMTVTTQLQRFGLLSSWWGAWYHRDRAKVVAERYILIYRQRERD